MPTALRERPAAAPVVLVAEPRRTSRGRRVLAGAAVAAGLLVGVPALGGLDLLPSLHDPLAEQTVDRTGPALLQSITDLHEYRAARGTFSVVVDLEQDTPYVPSMLSGERTTYVAQGSADGVVDLSSLGTDAVQSSPDRRSVTITLPHPTLTPAVVDPAASRVVGRDRGLLQRLRGVVEDSPTTERDVQAVAQQRLDEAARASDVRQRAEAGTRDMLTGLARTFGYSDVTVVFDGPAV